MPTTSRHKAASYAVRGGMVRDVQRHLIEDGVYDASDVIVDIDGKIRKRGGTVPAQGVSNQYVPSQIVPVFQPGSAQAAAIAGARAGSGGITLFHYALGGASFYQGSNVSTTGGEFGRPFNYQGLAVFPFYHPALVAFSPMYVVGGSNNSRTPPLTTASVVVTSGDPIVTLAAADAAAVSPGDIIYAANAGVTAAYVGVITSVSSTSVSVYPVPTFAIGAGTASALLLGPSFSFPPGSAGELGGARVGCSFQNRILLADVRFLGAGSVVVPAPTRIYWSVLPTESNNGISGGTVFSGLSQIICRGQPPLNFLDLPDTKQIKALVPIGPSQLIVLGVDRILRLTGTFPTITAPGQSLPVDVQPISTTVGCLSDRSVQETPYGAIWAYRDGVYRYDGSRLDNLMSGRIQTLWDAMQRTSGFAIYGSALVRGDQYVISTSAGGLICDLRSGNWVRYTGPAFSSSAIDPRDPKTAYAAKWYDTTAATPAATRDHLFDLGQVAAPTPTNARDHDGAMVQATVTTGALAPAGIGLRKRLRRVMAAADIKAVNAQANGNILALDADAERELYLPNSDAEFASTTWWRPFASGATTLPGIGADSATKRSGSYSIKVITVAATGADDGVIYDIPGGYSDGSTVYSVEVWVNLTTAGTVTLTCNGVTATTTTTGSWVQLQVSTRPGSGAVAALTAQITHSANSATFYVDDLHVAVLQPVQDRDGSLLLINGSAVHRDTQNARSGNAGFKVVCSGNANEGIAYFARGTYRANTAYTFSVWAKTISGSTTGGLAAGVTGDSASAAITLTSVYKKFTLTWTPTADRTDPEFVVRITAAAAATLACDDFQVAGADPQLDVTMIGGVEAEGDWADGSVVDESFSGFATDYEFATGSGTLSVSGGQLVPSSTALKILLFQRGAGAVKSRDGEAIVSYTPGHASDRVVLYLDAYDSINALYFEATSSFSIRKIVAGTITTLNTTASPTLTLGVQYWLRAVRTHDRLTVEHYTTDPALGGAAANTLSWTLSAADLAIFTNPGQFGMRITPGDTALRIDAFRCTPYSNLATVASGNDQPGLVRGDLFAQSEAATVVYRQYGDASECEINDLTVYYDELNRSRAS